MGLLVAPDRKWKRRRKIDQAVVYLSTLGDATVRFHKLAKAAPAAPITQEPPQQPTKPPQKSGPEWPDILWVNGKRHKLEGAEPAVFILLAAIWGKESVSVPDVVAELGKPKRTKYNSLKPTVCRLNQLMEAAKLGINWSKDRRENSIIYSGPPLAPSVSD